MPARCSADPELCVLDEPTTGLDPVNVRLVQDLLLERRRNGRTTILSTHQMNQVEALCDRVAMINKGQLMVYGAVDEVRRRSLAARGPRPRPRPAARRAAAVAIVIDESDGGLARHAGGRQRAVGRCWPRSSRAGARIDRFEPMLAPMEDIFLRVVREGRA